jgi:hypothetical protein
MKIFVSWSKEPAKTIAVELKHFLEMTLRTADVWVSDADLQKGRRWGLQLAQELDSTNVGIICVTQDNMQEPWLHFEAGALSKSMANAAIHPLCLRVDKSRLPSPLAQFQATVFEKEDFLALVIAINTANEAPEKESALRERFERGWTGLEGGVAKAFDKVQPAPAQTDFAEPAARATPAAPAEHAFSPVEEKMIRLLAHYGAIASVDLMRDLKVSKLRFAHSVDKLASYVTVLPGYAVDTLGLTKQGEALALERNWT